VTATRRPVVIGLAVAIALVVIAVLAGQGTSGEGAPLSPTSASPDGLKGLVLLMESFGAQVRTDEALPGPDTRVALLARDGLDDRGREDLRAWVRGGGTLVVADPGGNRYQVKGQPSCFGDGDTAYLIESGLGSGTVVSVGAPNLFVNTFLDKSDNSVLAMRLLQPNAPQPVAILASSAPGSGRTTLLDLVPDRVFQAFIQVGIAFLLYALWRARRLGRPVVEPQPVAIPGSQLVRAVGSLEQRTHATDRAAAALRHDVDRLARERYGLASEASGATVAQVVADRTALDRRRVEAALGDAPVTDENKLVALSDELDVIRKEILHGR
jgi:hypothetical protein